MEDTILTIFRIILEIIEQALAGDHDAQQKLKDILPADSFTKLVKETQDKLDREKFGPRS